jgi:hypothetical protein
LDQRGMRRSRGDLVACAFASIGVLVGIACTVTGIACTVTGIACTITGIACTVTGIAVLVIHSGGGRRGHHQSRWSSGR